MRYISESHSIQRWALVQERLNQTIAQLNKQLTEINTAQEVTLDTAELGIARVEASRKEAVDIIIQLDSAYALQAAIQQQLNQVSFRVGLNSLYIEVESIESVINLLAPITKNAIARKQSEEDLEFTRRQFNILKGAGESDSIRAERKHLKDKVFSIPVLGLEDTDKLAEYQKELSDIRDEASLNIAELRLSTRFNIIVREREAILLSQMGVHNQAYIPPTPAEEKEEAIPEEESQEGGPEEGDIEENHQEQEVEENHQEQTEVVAEEADQPLETERKEVVSQA